MWTGVAAPVERFHRGKHVDYDPQRKDALDVSDGNQRLRQRGARLMAVLETASQSINLMLQNTQIVYLTVLTEVILYSGIQLKGWWRGKK